MQAAGYSDVRVVFRDGANIAEAAPKRGAFLTMARIRRKATASSSPVQCLTTPMTARMHSSASAASRGACGSRHVSATTEPALPLLVGCIAQIAKLTSSSLVRGSHPDPPRPLAIHAGENWPAIVRRAWRLPRRHA